jgi:hypothetical protein
MFWNARYKGRRLPKRYGPVVQASKGAAGPPAEGLSISGLMYKGSRLLKHYGAAVQAPEGAAGPPAERLSISGLNVQGP